MTTNKGGRPSKYTPELVEEICQRIGSGEPLAVICRDDHMPDQATVWRWEQRMPEVSQAIARAREDGWDYIAYRCRLTARGDAGGESKSDVKRDKLIIETDLKLLAKWDPKRYGDRQQIEHSGSIASTSDPAAIAEQLVTMAVANPTMAPQIRAWAEQLIARLPE